MLANEHDECLTLTSMAFEAELLRISRLVYDDVSQLLYSTLLGLGSQHVDELDAVARQHFTDLKMLVTDLLNDIRRNASESQCFSLLSLGFFASLPRWIQLYSSRLGIRILYEDEGECDHERLSPDMERLLYGWCRDWIVLTTPHTVRNGGTMSLRMTRNGSQMKIAFHHPNMHGSRDMFIARMIHNPYMRDRILKLKHAMQILMEQSAETIIITFDMNESLE